MATTLPTPIEFRLPDDWRPAPPDEVGAPGAAFVALIPNPDQGFTANVTVDGEYRPDATALSSMADHSVDALRRVAGSVTVVNRAEVGSAAAPALTQTLRLVDQAERQLVQAQVYLSMLDTDDPAKRAVIRLVLTATVEQHRAVLPDFQWFVSTVRPEHAASEVWTEPSDPH
ncbi:MAG: hypothetical protein M3Z25_24390 [Actinomycetota bacterium]|nr:hypothetical protein [Actinomycetota bacterium]